MLSDLSMLKKKHSLPGGNLVQEISWLKTVLYSHLIKIYLNRIRYLNDLVKTHTE